MQRVSLLTLVTVYPDHVYATQRYICHGMYARYETTAYVYIVILLTMRRVQCAVCLPTTYSAEQAYADRARAALEALLRIPDAQLLTLRAGVAAAAPGLIYRREPATEADAVDILVERMRTLRLVPTAEESAEYAHQLATRRVMIDAQKHYESKRHAMKSRTARKQTLK